MVQGRPKRILWVEILNIATNVFIGCKKKQNLYWTGRLLKIFYPCARDLVTIDTNTFVQIKPNDCLLYCHIYCLCSLIMIFQTKRRRTFLFTPCQTVSRQAGQAWRSTATSASVASMWFDCGVSSPPSPSPSPTWHWIVKIFDMVWSLRCFFVKTYVMIRLSPSRLFSQCCLLLQV